MSDHADRLSVAQRNRLRLLQAASDRAAGLAGAKPGSAYQDGRRASNGESTARLRCRQSPPGIAPVAQPSPSFCKASATASSLRLRGLGSGLAFAAAIVACLSLALYGDILVALVAEMAGWR
jgi:hypothetical protein